MEEYEPKEQDLKSSPPPQKPTITLQQAIDFGEYDPKHLANFAEWHNLSIHVQWQLIRKALDTRYHQLVAHYAELNATLDYSKKPEVKRACKNIEHQLKNLANDKERLYIEYSDKMSE